MVLVLDNFEQVLDAVPIIADLLTSVASLRVLATRWPRRQLTRSRICSVTGCKSMEE
jgi:hypothetical protein